jgi:hypothetical protein
MDLTEKEPASTGGRRRIYLLALPLLLGSWALVWTQQGFWNPLFFTGMWTGAILLMYAAGDGYPGLGRHAYLTVLSIPLWWWFELVNARTGDWEYLGAVPYLPWQYLLFATAAFSTVVPALDAARGVAGRLFRPIQASPRSLDRRIYLLEMASGVVAQAGVFAVPDLLFPLVWVAPFAVLDGLVGLLGGRNLAADLSRGEWRLAAQVGAAGLLCGFLWEFWNFWAAPKWVYHIAYLDGARLFEMPLAGYGGYVPFAWGVYQFVALASFRLPGALSLAGRLQGLASSLTGAGAPRRLG